MKIDLHCHSKHSKRPSLWLMKKLGCPESFTEPERLYRMALEKGMGGVTITDHNVIDGALEIAHHPNVMLGCEYTTYFPEDRCKVHVLVWGFTEGQHQDLSENRENIYAFTDYLLANNIRHACAHPLYGPNDRLEIAHIEKLALLYRAWEWNGDMNLGMNNAVDYLIRNITREHIYYLADKHNLAPRGEKVWDKIMTAGSDDHSSLNLARCYTEVPGATDLESFWDGLFSGQAKVHCRDATPEMYARNIYGIAYQFYKSKFDLDKFVPFDPVLQFADRHLSNYGKVAESRFVGIQKFFLRRKRNNAPHQHANLVDLLRHEARELLESDPKIMHMLRGNTVSTAEELDKGCFDFVNALSNKVLLQLGNRMIERLNNHQFFDLFHTLGSAGALYTLVAPYFATYSIHAQNKAFAQEVLQRFAGGKVAPPEASATVRVVHFTDTFFEVNGVSRTLQQQWKSAQRLGKDYTVLACTDEDRPQQGGLVTFKGEGRFTLPEYSEITLLAPPLLKILEHVYEAGYTHIHVSTPGPMGLVGLAAARIMGLPVSGTYHTAFPQYGKMMTEDSHVEGVLWRLMLWFYEQMDTIFVPSAATARDLEDRGISMKQLQVYPRGVDCKRFHPQNKNGRTRTRLGIPQDAPLFLFVGRISGEKNLSVLVEAFKIVAQSLPEAQLVLVGDGPMRAELEPQLGAFNVVFTGFLSGAELNEAYADSDVLVFPSQTDTFGNVVLEAQASGVPVIVSAQGGPQENMLHEKSGIVLQQMEAEPLAQTMLHLAHDPELRTTMGLAGRALMEDRGFDNAFAQLWEMWTAKCSTMDTEARSSFAGLDIGALAKLAS